jgi:RNA 2',3'-cyclic 3'-phosphodiesterase
LFTGFALDYPVRRNLELLLEHLRPLAPLAWSPASNLHVTTKFIGSFPEERLDELKAALAQTPKPGPIELCVEGLGWFDNPHNPRSFFAAVRANEALAAFKRNLDGAAPEDRPYVPHVTLARVREKTDLGPLRRAIAELPSAEFGISIPSKHLLYKSEPRESASEYTVIGEFDIA